MRSGDPRRHAVITGTAGFVGSHLAERLLHAGWDVTGIDVLDDYYDPALKRANLASALAHPAFRFRHADVRKEAAWARVCRKNTEVIIHLAARAGVRASMTQPALYEAVNVTGSRVVLDAAQRAAVPRVVVASSSSVYGDTPATARVETDPVSPISPYAASKLAMEDLCRQAHDATGLSVWCLRLFTVYGPRQRPDQAIHRFASHMMGGDSIHLFGDPGSTRDYVYVEDVVTALMRAAVVARGFETINIGGGNPVSLSALLEALEHALELPARTRQEAPQPGDVRHTHADVSKARRYLEFAPSTSLQEGLARFTEWLTAGGGCTPYRTTSRTGSTVSR